MAQRYGTMAPHTRRPVSVLVMLVVTSVCVHMYSFAGMIKRMPPPKFGDTAIIDCHSEHTGRRYPGLLDRKNCLNMCRRWESESFRSYSHSVRSFRPKFRGELFRPYWGRSFRPNFKGGPFRPDFRGESFRPD